MNKKTSLFISCPAGTNQAQIKITGPAKDVIQLLAEANASILAAYFPEKRERQLAWAAAMNAKVVEAIADQEITGDPDDDEEDKDNETVS